MGQILDHFRDNKKDLISIIFLIILIVSLPFAFKLAKDRQIFSSKASDSPIKVLDTHIKLNGQTIEIDNPTLNLQITSPLELEGNR